jgi:hypothetical protein
MALTLTERFSYSAGGRKFVYVSVLHDESTTTFTGASVGLSYVEHMYNFGRYATSDIANTSVLLYSLAGTVPAGNVTVDIGYPMKAGSKTHHLLIGW